MLGDIWANFDAVTETLYHVKTCCTVSQHVVLYCHMPIALRTNFDAVMELLESTACGVTVPAIAFETFDDTWSLKRQASADRFDPAHAITVGHRQSRIVSRERCAGSRIGLSGTPRR